MTATRQARPAPSHESKFARLRGVVSGLLRPPSSDYVLLLFVILTLTGFGVVMVFSTSMTWSVAAGSSVFSAALRQTVMVVLGLIAFWSALKIPLRVVRNLSTALMGVTTLLLILVLIPGIGTGREEVGSQSWIPLGPIQLQPSELAKVAIAVWGASYLAGKRYGALNMRNPFVHFILVAGVWFGLVVLQGDLGMALSFAVMVAFLLIFAGIPWGFIVAGLMMFFAGLVFVFAGGGYRSQRFHTYFDALTGNFSKTQTEAFQSYQGFLSLADGSLGGVGLGQSRAKWFYLPEAKNDFVFAVIGEELGLWGGALVILLFLLLGFFGLRTATRAQNEFQGLMAAALTMGVVSQAFINIAYVIGLLPVTGIQLPMISAGGTSAVITVGSMGLLASVARHEPESVSAMQSYGRPRFDRIFFIGEPGIEAEERMGMPRRTRRETNSRAVPVTARPTAARRTGSVENSQSGDRLVGQRPRRTSTPARFARRHGGDSGPDSRYNRRR